MIPTQEILQTKPCRYGTMSFFKNDTIISRSLNQYGEWAHAEVEFLRSLLSPGDTVLDIGAFIGTHTLAFAEKVGKAGKVWSLEPHPLFFEVLKVNVEQNALTNVTLLGLAVSDKSGSVEILDADLEQSSNFGGNNLLALCPSIAGIGPRHSIKITSLDELGPDSCRLMKIDVENMEINVLKGARQTLRTHRPVVFAECNSLEHGWPVVEFANAENYSPWLLNVLAYNPNNFRHSPDNFFGGAREAGLVLVPVEQLSSMKDRLDQGGFSSSLIPISSIDDLALALLKKPQYKYEVLANTRTAAVLGVDFWANETEVENFKGTIESRSSESVRVAREIVDLRKSLTELQREYDSLDSALRGKEAELQATIADSETTKNRLVVLEREYGQAIQHLQRACADLDQIYSSQGWKLLSVYYKLRDKFLSTRVLQMNAHGGASAAAKNASSRWSVGGALQGLRLLRDMRLVAASGLFNAEWYLQRNPDVASAGINPLRHYIRRGGIEGRDPNPLFDSDWYLRQNPDVARAGVNPLRHYLRRGASEGRDPSPLFSNHVYLQQHPEAVGAGLNPLAHYLKWSAARGGDPKPIVGPNGSATQEIALPAPKVEGMHSRDYEVLSCQISDLRQSTLQSLRTTPQSIVSISEKEFSSVASSLAFSSDAQVEVSIVIPVFNELKFTLECLTSIRKYSEGVSYEVIVVDDDSSDRSQEILSRIAGLVYVRNETNAGFIYSCNRGAAQANGKYILFLNNDVQVVEGWLPPLVRTIKEGDKIGAVGPKILYPDGRLQEAGAMVNRDCTSTMIGLFDNPDLSRYNYAREVVYCSGACLLVDAKEFVDLGGFDSSFAPAYCEDCDLSFRLRAKGLRVMYNPESVVIHHLSVTSNNIKNSFKMKAINHNQQMLSQRWQREIDDLNQVRAIAFYLPQYHPIPENDRWWGKGFTEWANVAKARPNFVGHRQPHLPADLGFYDLRSEQVMEQQAELARRYGIYGFCYYYYWFAGKRLLQAPLERMLKTGKPKMPFCIAWANENWTRRWDGREHEVLIAQQHSEEDDQNVIRDMMRYFRDPNYIRINGRPLLAVYRINLFPDIRRTTRIWRDLCRQEGLGEIYLAMVESFEHAVNVPDPRQFGFDASIEFPPHGMSALIDPPGKVVNPEYHGRIHDYGQVVLNYLRLQIPGHVRFRTVMPCWDNTPRRQDDSTMFEYASPGNYQAWLESIIEITRQQNFGDERIVFINAWNEWGEGNHLEPDTANGHGFLEATRNALSRC